MQFHLFLPVFSLFLGQALHVLSRNTCLTLEVLRALTSYPACWRLEGVAHPSKSSRKGSSFPTAWSSVLTYIFLHFLIYDLTSTQCTHSGVWKTLCSHTMESLSFTECTRFPLLFFCSAFNLRCSEDLRFTSHKSPQSSAHFTNTWFSFHSLHVLAFFAQSSH